VNGALGWFMHESVTARALARIVRSSTFHAFVLGGVLVVCRFVGLA